MLLRFSKASAIWKQIFTKQTWSWTKNHKEPASQSWSVLKLAFGKFWRRLMKEQLVGLTWACAVAEGSRVWMVTKSWRGERWSPSPVALVGLWLYSSWNCMFACLKFITLFSPTPQLSCFRNKYLLLNSQELNELSAISHKANIPEVDAVVNTDRWVGIEGSGQQLLVFCKHLHWRFDVAHFVWGPSVHLTCFNFSDVFQQEASRFVWCSWSLTNLKCACAQWGTLKTKATQNGGFEFMAQTLLWCSWSACLAGHSHYRRCRQTWKLNL